MEILYQNLKDIELVGNRLSNEIDKNKRVEMGQFLTPAPIAHIVASQFHHFPQSISLIDPGAGAGILTAAFVQKVINSGEDVKECHLTAFEIEPSFWGQLDETLRKSCEELSLHSIRADYKIIKENFLEVGSQRFIYPLLHSDNEQFTHAILNPPYKKLSSDSSIKKLLLLAGINTVNLYSAFVWLASMLLEENGEISAITPRSFCNGTYYLPFRKAFLSYMKLESIHVFESRSAAFSEDEVLQENIIFHAIKRLETPQSVLISSSSGFQADENVKFRETLYKDVVNIADKELFIHITTDDFEGILRNQMEKFTVSVKELGIKVSTGPVVDFRVRNNLRYEIDDATVPLIYPETTRNGKVTWPPQKSKKPLAIVRNKETATWLIPDGWYVLVKRFTSKEEKRRVVATVLPPLNFPAIGLENHLNFFNSNGHGIEKEFAIGLCGFLNSSIFDNYFRQFSGHTQVNATDLQKIRYPAKEDIIRLGYRIGENDLRQEELDHLVQETLNFMPEAKEASQGNKRQNEALSILKDILVPREQQNERSALCLLALGDIKPETEWTNAQRPLRRITQMMDWFRDNYGKQYAPNTRETVRRQTMHQFIQLGLVIENPDKPNRPINSPSWCYQLTEAGLELIQSFGSKDWTAVVQNYNNKTINTLRERHRDLPQMPVKLPDGRTVNLTAGGHNGVIKEIIEEFCRRFTPDGIILCIGDAGEKFVVNETEFMKKLGLDIDPHGKMHDVVVYRKDKGWLFLIEAVTSHGPVDMKRHNELKELFKSSKLGLVFVTAFPNRHTMVKYLGAISWETEVWLADQPDHMIHFNGDRFLGPHE